MADAPDTTSADYNAMSDYWSEVRTLLEGEDAVKAEGKAFLPQFPEETEDNYKHRLGIAKYTNLLDDIIEGLSSKPFSKELVLKDDAADVYKSFAEDVDTMGNNLHVFAGEFFFHGIADGINWILIDHTRLPDGATRADERQMNARPYWVRIRALDLLWVETAQVEGREQITYAAIWEPQTIRDGWKQKTVERIRILYREQNEDGSFGRALFEIWEKTGSGWASIDEGEIAIGVVPLVPMILGRRKGSSWQINPPMKGVVALQKTYYRQETNLEYAKEQTAFPMLAANGVTPPLDEHGDPVTVPVGPAAVLYAPPYDGGSHGEWKYIEPSAQSLAFLATEIQRTEKQIRELGRQPLTVDSGNLTVITTAFAASKGNSAVQAWALILKDALELALVYTGMWLGQSESPEVMVHTDFDVGINGQETFSGVIELRRTGDISRKAALEEAKRRGIMSPEYDIAEDEDELDARFEIDDLGGDALDDPEGGMLSATNQDGMNGVDSGI